MIEIRAPSGDVVRFPDGTDDQTIDRVMRENYAPETAQAPAERGFWHSVGDNLVGYDDGVDSFGENFAT